MFGNTLYYTVFMCCADVVRVLCVNDVKIGVYFPMQNVFQNVYNRVCQLYTIKPRVFG
jgi:hypothetical protein